MNYLRNFDVFAYPLLDAVRDVINPNQISFVQETDLGLIGVNESNVDRLRLRLNEKTGSTIPKEEIASWFNVQDVCNSLAAHGGQGDPPELTQ
ncbi:MAG: hypothetical protein U0136_06370 [Bdellovibrionota bacterium]